MCTIKINYLPLLFWFAYTCFVVLDISGSMSSMFERQEGSPDVTKLDVAKKCLQTLTDQLKTRFAYS